MEAMSDATQTTRPVVVKCVFCDTSNRVDLARLSEGPRCGQCSRPIRLDRPLAVTDADFEKTIQRSSVPVLVDFHADWCGPCKVMAPALDDFARLHAGEALVLKLDTDANPETPARLGIRGIPTLIVFQDGRESRRHVGASQLPELETFAALGSTETRA
jgi:thioredoxin 2